ncbi:PREDICTED: solute carrier family 35 member E2-like [Branchiostoma belcheri]|uniref:Solute carrier family 35 member E2-like n=1 Tax=Branchiostoma belcheri TaxID=7741 RepID=A0A6P4XCD1_BRABE|nr:PREDICTED: solute carrier family 35 member E2-like [Branchiostoma belcheri]
MEEVRIEDETEVRRDSFENDHGRKRTPSGDHRHSSRARSYSHSENERYPSTDRTLPHRSSFGDGSTDGSVANDSFDAPRSYSHSEMLHDPKHLTINEQELIKITQMQVESKDATPENKGLLEKGAVIFLFLWYFFSFCTLILNKYILSEMDLNAQFLGAWQILCTTVFGFIQLRLPCGQTGIGRAPGRKSVPPNFLFNMTIGGVLRFGTTILALLALKNVAASFVETIKSTAPMFTVLITWMMLREKTGFWVSLSLIPIMGGLALCSSSELSFNTIGFMAAISTNIVECFQNVFSKKLLSNDKHKYSPLELQFYMSSAALVLLVPAWFFVDLPLKQLYIGRGRRRHLDRHILMALLFDGVSFHLQSVTAYALMQRISPVTHSVANTAKRALLIWLSVLVFGNTITVLSGLGSMVVLAGVVLYQRACDAEKRRRAEEIQDQSES